MGAHLADFGQAEELLGKNKIRPETSRGGVFARDSLTQSRRSRVNLTVIGRNSGANIYKNSRQAY